MLTQVSLSPLTSTKAPLKSLPNLAWLVMKNAVNEKEKLLKIAVWHQLLTCWKTRNPSKTTGVSIIRRIVYQMHNRSIDFPTNRPTLLSLPLRLNVSFVLKEIVDETGTFLHSIVVHPSTLSATEVLSLYIKTSSNKRSL